MEQLRAEHRNFVREEEPGIWSIHTDPGFAIGQRAYLVQTLEGNLLWDCVSLIDEPTIRRVEELGSIRAIAISHPHYYSCMAEWSEAFRAPVWIHANDRQWVMRPSDRLHLWEGSVTALFGGISLTLSGGHFSGYQVGYWPAGADGAGVLFAGDQPQVCMDPRWVTFLYSYPNWIPLDGSTVRRVCASLEPLAFDRLYGAFGRNVLRDAKGVIARSQDRYLRAIGYK
jgi:hypothetical protein